MSLIQPIVRPLVQSAARGMMSATGYAAVLSFFDADGTEYTTGASRFVDADGTAYTVTAQFVDADGTAYSV